MEPPTGKRDDVYYQTVSRYGSFIDELHIICKMAEIPYKSPHAFRHGHIHYGMSHCHNLSEMKALSENVMHSSFETTDKLYSEMNADQVNDFISQIGSDENEKETNMELTDEEIKNVMQILSKLKMKR